MQRDLMLERSSTDTDLNNADFLTEVINNYTGSVVYHYIDSFLLRSYKNSTNRTDLRVDHISLQLDDYTGTALDSVNLPTHKIDVNSFKNSMFGLSIELSDPSVDPHGPNPNPWPNTLVRAMVSKIEFASSKDIECESDK
jgi:hypothetical protein